MTQGTFINGRRPPTKKSLKEAIQQDPFNPTNVRIEATSLFGNEYDGPLSAAPNNARFTVVGPDPYTSRKWYATISMNPEKGWQVK